MITREGADKIFGAGFKQVLRIVSEESATAGDRITDVNGPTVPRAVFIYLATMYVSQPRVLAAWLGVEQSAIIDAMDTARTFRPVYLQRSEDRLRRFFPTRRVG